ncbi:substrate-binding domain-containing protein [Yersinia enterocolitica]|uniref:substrate-binding domain-containing protein n=1 Tax=Yersinia enterocolitica TaxID=630 RepID=UPI003AB7D712
MSANGALTINIIRELNNMKIVPGKDIGFLGIDDIEWSDIIANGITTIKQPTEKIGYSAMELLHSRIK